MLELEDLPRLQSLSPARDIDEDYPQTLLEPMLTNPNPNPKKKLTVRVPIGPPSKMTKLIRPTVASTPSTPSLDTPPTPPVHSTKNLTWRGEFQFTTLVSLSPPP
ncbi:Hypothetical predicted protein [Drosophila guanche]|uniref:Uncharacterized protein n=1 Tax=Drosophila guanche TaxID=7266 RepID=A0A3B0JCM4_DROGU|nr:Hypothetical predicted protein [Drosophila guanche]